MGQRAECVTGTVEKTEIYFPCQKSNLDSLVASFEGIFLVFLWMD
jgi:hypothetical protein